MKNRINILLVILVCLVVIASLAFIGLKPSVNGQEQKSKRITEVPQVITKVTNLEITNAKMDNTSAETDKVNLEVRNNSEKSIIAIVLESGDSKDTYGVIHHAFRNGDEPPKILAISHATVEIGMNANNLKPNSPIKIVGIMYSDETVEGEPDAIEMLRKEREEFKQRKGGIPKQ